MLRFKIYLLLRRVSARALGWSAVASAVAQVAAAVYADADGWGPWLVVSVGVLISLLLALIAWSGIVDVSGLLSTTAVHGANQSEHAVWIRWFESQRREHDARIGRLESKIDELLAASRSAK